MSWLLLGLAGLVVLARVAGHYFWRAQPPVVGRELPPPDSKKRIPFRSWRT